MSLGMHVSTHPSHGANPNPDLKLNRVGGWVATSPETMSSSSLSRLSMLFFHWAACAGNLGRKKMRGCGVLHCKKKKELPSRFCSTTFQTFHLWLYLLYFPAPTPFPAFFCGHIGKTKKNVYGIMKIFIPQFVANCVNWVESVRFHFMVQGPYTFKIAMFACLWTIQKGSHSLKIFCWRGCVSPFMDRQ